MFDGCPDRRTYAEPWQRLLRFVHEHLDEIDPGGLLMLGLIRPERRYPIFTNG